MADKARIVRRDDARICEMGRNREASVEDLYRAGEDRKAELIDAGWWCRFNTA